MAPRPPLADKTNPGRNLLMTRHTHPEWWHTEASLRQTQIDGVERMRRLRESVNADLSGLAGSEARGEPDAEGMRVDDDGDDDDDASEHLSAAEESSGSDYQPAPTRRRATGGVALPRDTHATTTSVRGSRKRHASRGTATLGEEEPDVEEESEDEAPPPTTADTPMPGAPPGTVRPSLGESEEDSEGEIVLPPRLIRPRPKGKGRAPVVMEEERAEDSGEESDGGVAVGGTGAPEELAEAGPEEEGDEGQQEEEEEEEDAVPADALGIDNEGWKYSQPKSQPLHYYVHKDAVGGVIAKTIKFDVDFASRDSVNRANKTRRLELDRSKKRHGVVTLLKRPSTRGREYSEKNDEYLCIIHEDYAIRNNGRRIPHAELTEMYNQLFPVEGRTEASILSHIERLQFLRDMRNSYPA